MYCHLHIKDANETFSSSTTMLWQLYELLASLIYLSPSHVTQNGVMIHGPCDKLNPYSPCMIDGICSKSFNEYTRENSNGYPEYRRRDNGIVHPVIKFHFRDKLSKEKFTIINVDNRWIVPHNLYLSTKYYCHINVEVCSSVKYLYLF